MTCYREVAGATFQHCRLRPVAFGHDDVMISREPPESLVAHGVRLLRFIDDMNKNTRFELNDVAGAKLVVDSLLLRAREYYGNEFVEMALR